MYTCTAMEEVYMYCSWRRNGAYCLARRRWVLIKGLEREKHFDIGFQKKRKKKTARLMNEAEKGDFSPFPTDDDEWERERIESAARIWEISLWRCNNIFTRTCKREAGGKQSLVSELHFLLISSFMFWLERGNRSFFLLFLTLFGSEPVMSKFRLLLQQQQQKQEPR